MNKPIRLPKVIELEELNAELLAALKKIRREAVHTMDVPMPLVDAISEAGYVIAKAEKYNDPK